MGAERALEADLEANRILGTIRRLTSETEGLAKSG